MDDTLNLFLLSVPPPSEGSLLLPVGLRGGRGGGKADDISVKQTNKNVIFFFFYF